MANLTTAEYTAKANNALSKAESNLGTSYEKAVAWNAISVAWGFMEAEQWRIDKEVALRQTAGDPALVISATALSYRTKAEALLAKAESWTGGVLLDPPRAAVTANTAYEWAHRWSTAIRVPNTDNG